MVQNGLWHGHCQHLKAICGLSMPACFWLSDTSEVCCVIQENVLDFGGILWSFNSHLLLLQNDEFVSYSNFFFKVTKQWMLTHLTLCKEHPCFPILDTEFIQHQTEHSGHCSLRLTIRGVCNIHFPGGNWHPWLLLSHCGHFQNY